MQSATILYPTLIYNGPVHVHSTQQVYPPHYARDPERIRRLRVAEYEWRLRQAEQTEQAIRRGRRRWLPTGKSGAPLVEKLASPRKTALLTLLATVIGSRLALKAIGKRLGLFSRLSLWGLGLCLGLRAYFAQKRKNSAIIAQCRNNLA